MKTGELLLKLSAINGVSGTEDSVVKYLEELLRGKGDLEVTPLGSLLCRVKSPKPGGVNILLDAHIDEIGMVVTYIAENGFLRVASCGGVDRRLLAASPVIIHTQNSDLDAVVCSIPPHLQGNGEKKNPAIDEIYIDTGLSAGECNRLIKPGDRITLRSYPAELLNGCVSGKALDNRAGCAVLIKALELLDKLDCGLTLMFSSLEETGGSGAKTGAYSVAPTHSVVVDASYAHTPDSPREKCGILAEGPMIGISPVLNRELSARLHTLAEEHEIPHQTEVMGSSTGTNADYIASIRGGVKTALVSVPLRYMHTPIEVVSPVDVENTAALVAALAEDIAKL